MNFKKNFKKVGIGLLISAIAISGAFAWLKSSNVANKHNDISVGTIDIRFANQDRKVTLTDNVAIPMTKAYAIENLTPYVFDIQNTGTIDLDYQIYVDGDSYSNSFPDNKINILLAPIADNATESDIKEALKKTPMLRLEAYKDLAQSSLKAGKTKKYAMLAFVDINTVLSEYDGNSVSFKLSVGAVQHMSIIEDAYNEIEKSLITATVTAGGETKNVEVYNIEGDYKTGLLSTLTDSGLANESEVTAIVEVKGEDYDSINSTATFDVTSIASSGDKVVIIHFNEETNKWEYISTETVDENGTVSADFTSYSPVAFIVIKPDGSSVQNYYDEEGNLIKTDEWTADGNEIITEYNKNGEIVNITINDIPSVDDPAINDSYELTTNMYYFEFYNDYVDDFALVGENFYNDQDEETKSYYKEYTGNVYRYEVANNSNLYTLAQTNDEDVYYLYFFNTETDTAISTYEKASALLNDNTPVVNELVIGETYRLGDETYTLTEKELMVNKGLVNEKAYRWEFHQTFTEFPILINEYEKTSLEELEAGYNFILYEGDIFYFESTAESSSGGRPVAYAAVNELYELTYTDENGEKLIRLDANPGAIGSDETTIMNDKGVEQIFVLESQRLITGTQVR